MYMHKDNQFVCHLQRCLTADFVVGCEMRYMLLVPLAIIDQYILMEYRFGIEQLFLIGVTFLFGLKTLFLPQFSTQVLDYRFAKGPEFLFIEGLRTHYL